MKMKSGLIGLVLIVFALTFVGSGDVGASNCYYLYFSTDDFIDCSDDIKDLSSWEVITIALHRDKTWEGTNNFFESSEPRFGGHWDVFGNAIGIATDWKYAAIWGEGYPLFAGTKTGSAKLLPDPYKSKANIAKAQGYFSSIVGGNESFHCWALKKVKNKECPWMSE